MYRFERWRELIQAAGTEEAVYRVVREYVKMIPESVVMAMPAECQAALASRDVQSAAISLLHCELTYRGDASIAELLHEMAHTYAAASMRIARLAKDSLDDNAARSRGGNGSGEDPPQDRA